MMSLCWAGSEVLTYSVRVPGAVVFHAQIRQEFEG